MLSLTHLRLSHALSLLSNDAKRNSDFYIISRALSQFLLPITNNCTLCCHSILPTSNIVVAPDCGDDSRVPLTPQLIDACIHALDASAITVTCLSGWFASFFSLALLLFFLLRRILSCFCCAFLVVGYCICQKEIALH